MLDGRKLSMLQFYAGYIPPRQCGAIAGAAQEGADAAAAEAEPAALVQDEAAAQSAAESTSPRLLNQQTSLATAIDSRSPPAMRTQR